MPGNNEEPAVGRSRSGLTLGARLTALRRSRGRTLEELARHLGISKPSVWAWEHDRSKPKPERLAEIAEYLETDVNDLVDAYNGGSNTQEVIGECKARIAQAYDVPVENISITINL